MNDLASFSASDIYNPDGLLSHDADNIISRAITLLSGQANLLRGTVLGKIILGAASSAAKSGGNTGNGTLVLDATTPILPNAAPGIYAVRNIIAGTNTGTFIVTGPDGKVVGEPIIVAGAGGTITFANQIKFVLTDGSTDFIVGDGFDVTIAAGSGKYVKSLLAAVDGSQVPDAILSEDTDATSADKATVAYFKGNFHDDAVIFGTGQTIANTRDALRGKGIHLVNRVPAT